MPDMRPLTQSDPSFHKCHCGTLFEDYCTNQDYPVNQDYPINQDYPVNQDYPINQDYQQIKTTL